MGSVAERLLPIYHAGGGIGDTAADPPYIFIPIHEGWLQLAIQTPQQPEAAAPTDQAMPRSAMSGRVFVSHGNSARAALIDDASSVRLTLTWTGSPTPVVSSVDFAVGKPRDQLLGFVCAAETSPTPREALPTLRGGPAATREVPLWFGALAPKPSYAGKFSWARTSNSFSASLNIKPAHANATSAGPFALAWLPKDYSPFITSIPLTRTLSSSPDPSPSRGLLP
ncbi:MAG: hypothetical protein MO852_06180 [Candidatus Devosia euplotis]|nr:hypothetical protein [Candidatus Devosia euplotis]